MKYVSDPHINYISSICAEQRLKQINKAISFVIKYRNSYKDELSKDVNVATCESFNQVQNIITNDFLINKRYNEQNFRLQEETVCQCELVLIVRVIHDYPVEHQSWSGDGFYTVVCV